MELSFLGAAQEVTGSMHLIKVNGKQILLDCGLYQGRRADTYERNLNFPFKPSEIDAVILSHAHIDHAGNLPNLVRQGFNGTIWCTAATRNLSTYMLMDSGHIQEQDIRYVNKKRKRKGEEPVEPIYTGEDAKKALLNFVGIGFNRTMSIADGVDVTFHTAGHILGAAISEIDIREHETGKKWKVVFSGDLGREEMKILKPPVSLKSADIVIMESTYGNREHGDVAAASDRLRDVICQTVKRHGKIIVPAFSVGRTQEIVYALNLLDAEGDIPTDMPVYVDSPLAVNATDVFRMHPEVWNTEVQEFLIEGRRRSPFDYDGQVEYVRSAIDSKRINHLNESVFILSASGMAEAGRILHHLKNNIEDPKNTILMVNYMAQHTLGRRIRDGVSPVRIFGDEYEVKAQVEVIDGYSAHADRQDLLRWARGFDAKRLENIFLVHGEPDSANALADGLKKDGSADVQVPTRGQKFTF